jgi:hypothetical protein
LAIESQHADLDAVLLAALVVTDVQSLDHTGTGSSSCRGLFRPWYAPGICSWRTRAKMLGGTTTWNARSN